MSRTKDALIRPETFPKLNQPKPFNPANFKKGYCYYLSVKLDGIKAIYYNNTLYNRQWQAIPHDFYQKTLGFSKSNLVDLPNGTEGVLNYDFSETNDTSYRFTVINNIFFNKKTYLQSKPTSYTEIYNDKFTRSLTHPQLFFVRLILVFDLAEVYGYLAKWTQEGYSGVIIEELGDTYLSSKLWKLEPDPS